MAVDKLVDSTQLDADLTSVANAIRAKSGGSGQLAFPAGFVSEIGNISGGGDDVIIAPGACSTYSISSVIQPIYDFTNFKTRRCLLKKSGDHSMWVGLTDRNYSTFSGLYPLEVPSNTTSVSISATGPGQCIYMAYKYVGNNYTKTDDSGWVNLPIVNGEISSEATHIGISFRVNSSSSQFSSSTQPTNVSVTFE